MKKTGLQKQLKSAWGIALLAAGWSVTPHAQIQIGADIDGEAAGDNSGYSVALDGDRLAIGAIGNDGNGYWAGHVRVYDWDGSAWVQLGADIDGEAEGDYSGYSVALDGDRLAIGAIYHAADAGHVRVYEWSGTAWTQLGGDIDGETASDEFGYSVSLDGNRLAIGAPDNHGNGIYAGHVRVYDWDGSAWVQLGADIDGEAERDESGYSVALDGDRLAIGAPNNDGNGSLSGHVRVYEWSGTAWTRLGSDIDGEAEGDYSGRSVAFPTIARPKLNKKRYQFLLGLINFSC